VDAAQVGRDAVQTLLRRTGTTGSEGLLPDERLTLQIRDELEGLSLWTPRLDVTTVDGTVYLRGRDSNPERAEAVVHTIRGLEGVQDVVDEIRRE
jgi:osmotically-inducible protein OsmY